MASNEQNDGTGQEEQLNKAGTSSRVDLIKRVGKIGVGSACCERTFPQTNCSHGLIGPENQLDSPSEMEHEHTSHPLLGDIQAVRGCLTGFAVNCNTSCTAADGQTCERFKHLPLWNEVLFPAHLQVREILDWRSRLSLVNFVMPDFQYLPLKLVQNAWTLAHCLLKSHQCIVDIDLSLYRMEKWKDLLFEALKGNSSVESLKIGHYSSDCAAQLSAVLLSMERLEKLEFGYGEGSSQLLVNLSKLLRTTTSLRFLSIHRLQIDGDASLLIEGLSTTSTLKELSISEIFITSASIQYRHTFEKYLEKSVALTTFNYFAQPGPSRGSTLRGVLDSLLKNKTLRHLGLADFALNCESANLITKFLEATECLHRFKLISMKENFGPQCCEQENNHTNWIFAVARSNTLKEVTFSMHLCSAPRWGLFLETLASNPNTIKINFEAYSDSQDGMVEFCEALAENCIGDRVSFPHRMRVQDVEVLKCKAISRVSVSLAGSTEHWPILHQLGVCRHISSIELKITWTANQEFFVALADYIKTTKTLKELELCTRVHQTKDPACWAIFSRSLSHNTSIMHVGIESYDLMFSSAELLADILKSRGNTCRVTFNSSSLVVDAFVRRLSVGIADNFTLINVTLPEFYYTQDLKYWLLLNETISRNSGLLSRASLFVTGISHERRGAQALERLYCSATLLEQVMRQTSVGSNEAASMVRRALQTIEDLDGFMRICGVVRDRVVCLPRRDGRPQLDSLHAYCWRQVRRYLLLEDVHTPADCKHLNVRRSEPSSAVPVSCPCVRLLP